MFSELKLTAQSPSRGVLGRDFFGAVCGDSKCSAKYSGCVWNRGCCEDAPGIRAHGNTQIHSMVDTEFGFWSPHAQECFTAAVTFNFSHVTPPHLRLQILSEPLLY